MMDLEKRTTGGCCSLGRLEMVRWYALHVVAALVACGPYGGVLHADSATKSETNTRDITFDDIAFEMKKGAPFKRTLLTDKIDALNGQRIKIRGYILPSFLQKGITKFVLVRDNMECCFGPGAALYDCILVEMAEGKSTSFTIRPVSVEGKFSIREFKGPDGKHLAIYHIEGVEVK